jgi:iron complex transport system substrate-binding protein
VLFDSWRDWRAVLLYLADVVGEHGKAETLLNGVDTRLAELQPRVQAAWPNGVRVSLLRFAAVDGTVSLVDPDRLSASSAARLLRQVKGVTVTGAGTAPNVDDAFKDVSAERLREVEADVLLYFAGGGGAQSRADAALKAVVDNPLWQGLQAVRAGRAHRIDSYVWFDGFGTTAANLGLDDLFVHLT